MATVRGVTARYLGGFQSPQTRLRYKKDIMLWQKFCLEYGFHPLDFKTAVCQEFVDWMAQTKTPGSVRARIVGVSGWFDALVDARIVPSNGMRGVKKPKWGDRSPSENDVSDADVAAIMVRLGKLARVGSGCWAWWRSVAVSRWMRCACVASMCGHGRVVHLCGFGHGTVTSGKFLLMGVSRC